MRPVLEAVARATRRGVVFLVGAALVLAGVVMLFVPGPGIAVVLLGLAVLSTEFDWARRLLTWVKRQAGELRDRARGRSRSGGDRPDRAA
jgi:uncharacterized protein (TIGR02611 family)